MRFCNITLRIPDFRARIFELETRHTTLVSDTATQLAVPVVRKGWKDLLFQSRWAHSINPRVTPAMMVWSHFPLEALGWRRSLLFYQKRQSNRMRNSCIYLSIQDVNPHPTSLFSTFYPPSLLHIFVLIRSRRPVEICIKMLLTWEVAGHMSQNCYFNKLMKISIHWLNSGSYFQALLWLCDGQTLYICVCACERESHDCPVGTWLEKILFTQNYSAYTSIWFWVENISSAWRFIDSSADTLIQLS